MTWHWFCTDMRENIRLVGTKSLTEKYIFDSNSRDKKVRGVLESKYITSNLYSTNRLSSTFAYDLSHDLCLYIIYEYFYRMCIKIAHRITNLLTHCQSRSYFISFLFWYVKTNVIIILNIDNSYIYSIR